MKLLDFQHYYNGHRTHAGLGGKTQQPNKRAQMQRPGVYRVRIDGSRTVGGCIKRRWRRDARATGEPSGKFRNS